jgi:hypothetical protein
MIKDMSGTPQDAGFCTIYPTASVGLGGPQTPGLNCLASLRSPFSTYFFKIASYLLIVRYLIIIILKFIAVSFYTNKSFMPNT